MYDSPKAAHFDAYRDGVKLGWNDPAGLDARWKVARVVSDRLSEVGMSADMMRMNSAKIAAIEAAIAELNADNGITVKLAAA